MKKFNKKRKKKNVANFSFLMVSYEMPELIKAIQQKINPDDLYIKDNDYGIQEKTHITIAPSVLNTVNLESLKPYLKDISYYEATITGFGKYICDEFDVLKCDIDSNSIIETNKEIFKHFHCYSRAKIFLPHLTIAYLKKGEADKYILKHFTDKIELVPKEFMWSWVDKDLVRQTLYFK